MTAYVTFQALKDKKIDLNQMVNVSVKAWKVDPSSSKMFIDPATPVKVNDLLHGLMVQSGNDAAVALAEAVAGDEGAFVVADEPRSRAHGPEEHPLRQSARPAEPGQLFDRARPVDLGRARDHRLPRVLQDRLGQELHL